MRRFFDLDLVRKSNPMCALSWMIMHKITESSPLYGMTPEVIEAAGDELFIVISGTAEAMAQTIYPRTAYEADDIRWKMRCADILTLQPGVFRELRLPQVPRGRAAARRVRELEGDCEGE